MVDIFNHQRQEAGKAVDAKNFCCFYESILDDAYETLSLKMNNKSFRTGRAVQTTLRYLKCLCISPQVNQFYFFLLEKPLVPYKLATFVGCKDA